MTEQEMSLSDLAYNAYGNEEMCGDIVHDAVAELNKRGYSKDEIYKFVTWGDNVS
jgi:hypothetical protein